MSANTVVPATKERPAEAEQEENGVISGEDRAIAQPKAANEQTPTRAGS